MNPSQFKKALSKAAEACDAKCMQAAEVVRAKYVIPFCNRTGMSFRAGMGTWSFHGDQGRQYGGWNDSDLPKRLREILCIEYPLNRGQDIGSLMQDYTPPNY